MASRFTSTVKLYKVEDIGNGRFPAFSTIANQTTYFESKKKHTVSNCKIIRGKGTMRVNVPTKTFYKDINYLSYINPDYDNKVFYGLVTGYSYVNDQCTELSFAIDYIQTFMFDIECVEHETYIEREHLSAARKALEDANPFSKDLWELNTQEPLNVSEGIYNWGYVFHTHDYAVPTPGTNPVIENDAELLFGELPSGGVYAGVKEFKTLVYVSNINFDDFADPDTGDNPTKDKFEAYVNCGGTVGGTTYTAGSTDFCIDYSGTYHGGVSGSYYYNGDSLYSQFPAKTAIFCFDSESSTADQLTAETLLTDLTNWGCVSSIVNVVIVPTKLLFTAFYTSGNTPEVYSLNIKVPSLEYNNTPVNNKKLYRSPFSFIRIITPDGAKQEWSWERFRNIAEAYSNIVEVALACDLINGVSIIAMPCHYQNSYNEMELSIDKNVDTSAIVKYNKFPTAPYNIDAYLAQLSAIAQEKAKLNTELGAQERYADNFANYSRLAAGYQAAELGSSVISGLMSAGASITDEWSAKGANTLDVKGGFDLPLNIPGAVKGIIDAPIAQQERELRNEIFMKDAAITADAARYLAGNGSGIFAQNYSQIKPAYAVDRYIPPTGDGFENYTVYGWLNIALQKMYLLPQYLEMYDKYFDNFGYTSGRTGVPYIMNFINGGTDQPYWVNGETYVKTTDAHFKGTFQYVCDLWAQTFNGGIHWINGDNLIQGA